ncbi:MAG: hypothetical protein GJ680_07745 [Alteromonadaceae bacterium]|nr:hypothetical protein [Alteromonadaceae bacterium]
MQFSLFDQEKNTAQPHVGLSSRVLDTSEACRSLDDVIEGLVDINRQVDGFSSDVLLYRSGTQRSPNDFKGYSDARVPICIALWRSSETVRSLAKEHVKAGNFLMLDHGEYERFRYNIKHPNAPHADYIEFDDIFDHYEDIVSVAKQPSLVSLVLPDKIGDQQGSLALLRQYKDRIATLQGTGAELILPLQKGMQSLETHYHQCLDVLPAGKIGVALPSNAEALSEHDILRFCKQILPNRIHFLGSKPTQVLYKVQHICNTAIVTCDATRHRAHIGQGRLLTDLHRHLVDEKLIGVLHGDWLHYDETEFLGNIHAELMLMTPSEVVFFSEFFHADPQILLKCSDDDQVWRYLDDCSYGYSESIALQAFTEIVRRRISPNCRQLAISQLAEMNVI